ncbi:hypothetical protein WHR41_01383 [Cladosporium halotolerans]|uniref:Uncharacterized protein n=1 Tax=Cladosporium halotolerans TaxID=1052096 RepID=A0AB34L312_9PEZI
MMYNTDAEFESQSSPPSGDQTLRSTDIELLAVTATFDHTKTASAVQDQVEPLSVLPGTQQTWAHLGSSSGILEQNTTLQDQSCASDTLHMNANRDDEASLEPLNGGKAKSFVRHPLSWNGSQLNIEKIVLDTWICEIIAVLFSSACIIAIAAIVYVYDDKPIPRFPSGLTLNTIISILSTSARSAIIMTVSTSLSQLKWCWFKIGPGKRIQDLQTMDDASRGLLGATGALTSRTGGSLATLGCVVTLLLLTFSPFVQQLLDYPTRYPRRLTDEAGAPQNLNYTIVPGQADYRSALQRAILAGLNLDSDVFGLVPKCPTGRCEWDNYKSVGWCSKCEDFTARATFDDCDYRKYMKKADLNLSELPIYLCNITLEKGGLSYPMISIMNMTSSWSEDPELGLEITKEAIWVSKDPESWRHSDEESRKAFGVDDPLLTMAYVVMESSWFDVTSQRLPTYKPANATQCMITFCDLEYAVSVNDGKSSSNVVSTNLGTFFEYTQDNDGSPSTDLGWRPGAASVTFSSTDLYAQVNQSERAFWPVSIFVPYIPKVLLGNISYEYTFSSNWSGTRERPDSRLLGVSDEISVRRNITATFESLADSLTDFGLRMSNNFVPGYAISEEIYVHVRWQWIVLPVLLHVASISLFISTVVYSNRIGAPIWKSSLLAVWYHSTKESLRDDAELKSERTSDMNILARATAIRLSRSDHDLRHVFRKVPVKTGLSGKMGDGGPSLTSAV